MELYVKGQIVQVVSTGNRCFSPWNIWAKPRLQKSNIWLSKLGNYEVALALPENTENRIAAYQLATGQVSSLLAREHHSPSMPDLKPKKLLAGREISLKRC